MTLYLSGLLVFAILLQQLKVIQFPQVSGLYKDIGYKIISFNENEFNKDIAVFYPAQLQTNQKYEDVSWVPNSQFYRTWMETMFREPPLWFRVVFTMILSFMEKIPLGVYKNAPIEKSLDKLIKAQLNENSHQNINQGQDLETRKLKIIIFSHGYLGNLNMNSTFCKELASQGYLVFSIQHYEPTLLEGYKDAKTINEKLDVVKQQRGQHLEWRTLQVQNLIQFLKIEGGIEKLFPREDFEVNSKEFILMGHSFGGVTAVQSALQDLKGDIKAVIGLDPWLYPMDNKLLSQSVDIPMLFINSETFSDQIREYKISETNKQFFQNQKVSANKFMCYFRNMDHINPSDVPFLIPRESQIMKMTSDKNQISDEDGEIVQKNREQEKLQKQENIVNPFFDFCAQKIKASISFRD